MTTKHKTHKELEQKALTLKASGLSSREAAWVLKISQSTVVRLWNKPRPPKLTLVLSFEELTEGQQDQVLRLRKYDDDGEIERRYIENIAQFRLIMRQKNVRPNRNN